MGPVQREEKKLAVKIRTMKNLAQCPEVSFVKLVWRKNHQQ